MENGRKLASGQLLFPALNWLAYINDLHPLCRDISLFKRLPCSSRLGTCSKIEHNIIEAITNIEAITIISGPQSQNRCAPFRNIAQGPFSIIIS